MTSTPATRRMGHTMLGVAPSPAEPGGDGSAPAQDPPNQPEGHFQPFATAPGTLTGLNPGDPPETQPEDANVEQAPQTLTGLAGPTRTPQHQPGRTLMGFGAWPAAPVAAQSPAAPPSIDDHTGAASASIGEASRVDGVAAGAHATLMGVSPLVGLAAAAPENGPDVTAAKPQFKGTLLGVSPIGAAHIAQSPPALTEQRGDLGSTLAIHDGPSAVAGARPPAQATIAGVVAPSAVATPNAVLGQATVPHGPVGMPQGGHAHKGTLLGVAMPGIAPLQPGHVKSGAPTPAAPAVRSSEPPQVRRPTAEGEALRAQAERAQAARAAQGRRLAWVFGTAAALLIVLIVVALGVWWTSVHLTVAVTTGDSGNENLTLTCSNCTDGTRATIDAKTATFHGGRATIELGRRLSIGDNRLALQVIRPGRTRGETVNVVVPVEFRVTSSIAELAASPPAISIQCDAAPGTRLVIDDQINAVGPSGQLKVPLDVSSMLTGQAAAVLPFERNLAYEVIREGQSTKGSLVVRTGITPLELVTPGSMHVTQNATFTLSGRTSAQAKLTANGHNIAVAADGSFLQEMALSAPGATKLFLRAQEPNLAPRLVEISLERVTNLRQRADELARSLPTDFDSISTLAVTKPDSLVALHAEVVAVESAGPLTRLVATSSCKQQPCLASIRCTGPLSVRRGSRVIALGKARLTQRPNTNEHDLAIEAALVVEDSER